MSIDENKVLVAMSGGVDSSVAAGLLTRAGYACVGAYMDMFGREGQGRGHGGQDAADAAAVAEQLGMEFVRLDCREWMAEVIDYFVGEYKRGRTPNPCVRCNMVLKFGKLLDKAAELGAGWLATGHYARIEREGDEVWLTRAQDKSKDQSYALFGMGRERLKRVLFPNGAYRKAEIRAMAGEWSLPVREKAESQEICFVPGDDYGRFLRERGEELPGRGVVTDTGGKVLGEHEGIYQYTIGQRKGLGIALGEPAYVVRLDAASNTVVLGSKAEVMGKGLRAREVVWLREAGVGERFRATVQIRYNHRGAASTVTVEGDGASVEFDESVEAITPGQAAVFYDDKERIVGGGWIDQVW